LFLEKVDDGWQYAGVGSCYRNTPPLRAIGAECTCEVRTSQWLLSLNGSCGTHGSREHTFRCVIALEQPDLGLGSFTVRSDVIGEFHGNFSWVGDGYEFLGSSPDGTVLFSVTLAELSGNVLRLTGMLKRATTSWAFSFKLLPQDPRMALANVVSLKNRA